jgi:hypothetical protein
LPSVRAVRSSLITTDDPARLDLADPLLRHE